MARVVGIARGRMRCGHCALRRTRRREGVRAPRRQRGDRDAGTRRVRVIHPTHRHRLVGVADRYHRQSPGTDAVRRPGNPCSFAPSRGGRRPGRRGHPHRGRRSNPVVLASPARRARRLSHRGHNRTAHLVDGQRGTFRGVATGGGDAAVLARARRGMGVRGGPRRVGHPRRARDLIRGADPWQLSPARTGRADGCRCVPVRTSGGDARGAAPARGRRRSGVRGVAAANHRPAVPVAQHVRAAHARHLR